MKATFKALCAVAAFAMQVGGAAAAPLSLFITYDTTPFGLNEVGQALQNHGHAVDTIIAANAGDLATALGRGVYTNVFLWDIGVAAVLDATDLGALQGWYGQHRNIVIDGRSYGAFYNGIAGDEGVYLDNVADSFDGSGGGLWVGADHEPPWTPNANLALAAIGINPIVGEIASTGFHVATSDPVMQNVAANQLLWSWSAGQVPTCAQPNGQILRAIGWDNNNVPLISANRGSCQFAVPEPGSLNLVFLGLGGLAASRWGARRRTQGRLFRASLSTRPSAPAGARTCSTAASVGAMSTTSA